MSEDTKSYAELVKEARKLGINFVGKRKGTLAKLIEKAKADSKPSVEEKPEVDSKPPVEEKAKAEPKPPVGEKPNASPVEKEKADPLKSKKKFDTVVILKGKMEIRRYTPEIHGKDFAKLAGKFAKDRGFSVEVLTTKKRVKCPSCGHAFDL